MFSPSWRGIFAGGVVTWRRLTFGLENRQFYFELQVTTVPESETPTMPDIYWLIAAQRRFLGNGLMIAQHQAEDAPRKADHTRDSRISYWGITKLIEHVSASKSAREETP
jgi:hypothetical protein